MSIKPLNVFASVLVLVLAAAGATFVIAQDHADGDDAAMMAAWMKAATPAEHHKHMAQTVGNWDYTATFWMAPGAPPIESSGTATTEAILGGRYFQSTVEGSFMGQPFHGLEIDGYDNIKEKHVGTWYDTAGTMIMVSEGTCKDGGRVTTSHAEMTDPMTGRAMKIKNVVTMVSANEMRYESYDGDRKTMDLIYKRK